MWNKVKPYLTAAFTGIIFIKEIWEIGSDKPLVTGVSNLATVISQYWLLVLSFLMFVLLALPSIIDKVKGLEKVYNRHFRNEEVVIDRKHFLDCRFENCTILWNGENYHLDNVYVGQFRFYTENDTVVRTINLLKGLGLIDQNFAKNIRRVPKK